MELNTGIGDAENRGDREWLAATLAPKLAFQRADPARTVDDLETFLSRVTKGGDRTTNVNAIDVRGDIAVVRCTVCADGKYFDNARLFVRRNNDWKLLGWANEPAAT